MRPPTRAELASAALEPLKRGGPTKADLFLADLGGGTMVIKDFRDKRPWVRLVGRLQIGHECRAYRRLGSLTGVPRLFGRVDPWALALEHIDGRQLGYAPERRSHGPELFARLQRLVARLHERGVVHWDLRSRDNVLVRPDGGIVVIDLASAVWLRPGSLLHRLLFRRLQSVDRSALLKWRELLAAGPHSAEELAFLRRHRVWRGLWPFNRKSARGRRKS